MKSTTLIARKVANTSKGPLEVLRTERPRAKTYEEYLSSVWLDEGDQPASRELFEATERYSVAWRVGRMTRDAALAHPELDSLQEECARANEEERAAFRALRQVIPDATPIQGGLA